MGVTYAKKPAQSYRKPVRQESQIDVESGNARIESRPNWPTEPKAMDYQDAVAFTAQQLPIGGAS